MLTTILHKSLLLLLFIYVANLENIKVSESIKGTCHRINKNTRKNGGGCGKVWRFGVTKQQCCSNPSTKHFKHTWSFSSYINTTCEPCPDLCEGYICDKGQRCVVKGGHPKCMCAPKCHLKHKSTVCGSDARTYQTECHLLKRACRKKKRISVVYTGPCETCSGVRCNKDNKCVLDEYLSPQCRRCPKKCPIPKKIRTICAVDGKTYPSMCHLKLASCKAGYDIAKAYRGPCIKNARCHNVKCWKNHICHTDSLNQSPQCRSCRQPSVCEPAPRHICASDGNFYHSSCALKHEACRSRTALAVIPQELCYKNSTQVGRIINNCFSLLNSLQKKHHKNKKHLYYSNSHTVYNMNNLHSEEHRDNRPSPIDKSHELRKTRKKVKSLNLTSSEIRRKNKKRIKECRHIVTGRIFTPSSNLLL